MTGKRQRKDDDEGIRAKSGLFKASADATAHDETYKGMRAERQPRSPTASANAQRHGT